MSAPRWVKPTRRPPDQLDLFDAAEEPKLTDEEIDRIVTAGEQQAAGDEP